ncbi:SusD/RagB family nutrient-binding outer membrane lipoprotein [Aestuariivivens sediminicola]|uniref:SusD/RagB family nutrient-binding outer membrane lipoprotein n=1 Tax=Aestuariivivens sediminicola TaxID=2913560 RepID=UPI001F57A5C9|nr:SusD/RagB family nutrient-binding outer membrane lipoprotein [Aestuariivivens sediminicola]
MKKLLIPILSVLVLLSSCAIDENLNRDQKNPTAVPGEGFFSNALKGFFDLMNDINVNRNVYKLYAQYWAQTTYPDESQYNQTTRDIGGGIWNRLYRDVLQDLKGSRETLIADEADNLDNKLAVIEFMEIFTYSVLVDTFGDVPYSEALDPTNPAPQYDDAATIYSKLLERLDAVIGEMNGGTGFEANQDPVYGGDMDLWKKAANSLRLRLGMRLADVNPSLAQSTVQKALNAPLILENSENFGIDYLGGAPNTNPLYTELVLSGRNDFVAADTFVDELLALNDPRIDDYFALRNGQFIGGVYGSANSPTSSSHPSALMKDPTLRGNILTATEVFFLHAEAAERGFGITGAASFYHAAIELSIMEWTGTEEEADTYIAQAEVNYATAPGTWQEKISLQKWIALYNSSFEGFNVYRIYDALPLKAPEDMTLADIPTRFLYPEDEATLNPVGYDSASSAIGGDTRTTKLFWDVN